MNKVNKLKTAWGIFTIPELKVMINSIEKSGHKTLIVKFPVFKQLGEEVRLDISNYKVL